MKILFCFLALAPFVVAGQFFCKVNEVYDQCGTCEKTCNDGPGPIACAAVCKPGCYCAKNYVRNIKGGICIPTQTCPGNNPNPNPNPGPFPPYCGVNEVYNKCGYCDKICGAKQPVCAAACREGCFCADGYVRSQGICIPQTSCPGNNPGYCGVNEVYKKCGYCDKICGNNQPACAAACREGCFCADGYVRSQGICIPQTSCPNSNPGPFPPYCGVNEVYQKCGYCDKICGNNQPVCAAACREGCFCADGYVRSQGICIPRNSCPGNNPGYCGVNEVYKTCGYCDNICGDNQPACAAYCREGCFCADGYVRSQGICIPRNSCPKPNPAPVYCNLNEVYIECGGCDQFCGDASPPACDASCRPGCYCQNGYVRSFQGGICLPPRDCPRAYDYGNPPMVENSGPVYDDYSSPPIIANPAPQCGPHEVYKYCGVGWQCEDYCGRGANACAYCEDGCYCEDGYVRDGPDYDAVCVPKDSCPRAYSPQQNPTPQCGPHEVYKYCGVGWQCEDYCGRGANACAYCEDGCYCETGYVRDGPGYDAVCVPKDSCPRAYDNGNPPMIENSGPRAYDYDNPPMVENSGAIWCNGANEEYQQCGVGKQCEDYCGRGPIACASYCQNGCYCMKGFVRSGPEANAECVPEQSCPRAYDNGNPPMIENSGGFNDYDYGFPPLGENSGQAYDYNNPPPMMQNSGAIWCNGANEEYQQCGVGKQCEDYCGRGPIACTTSCQSGCYCMKGFVRSGPEPDSKCVREETCPRAYGGSSPAQGSDPAGTGSVSDGGPIGPGYNCRPDEEFNICGVGQNCEDYCKREPNACAACVPACYCKEGTVRAGPSNTTRCVPREKCETADKCGKNEYYDTCGTACPANCENKKPNCSQPCVPGCFCKKGYIRKYADVQVKRYECIKAKQCPNRRN